VSYPSIRIAKKLKKEKLILVTDAMPPAGTDLNTFKLSNGTIYCREGKCTTKDGIIAGSVLTLSTAVRNCVQNVGIELDEALRMASTYPAKAINVHSFLGKIKKDYIANLVIFDNELEIKGTIVNGIHLK
jgi:N-acetylglucosamine-6-phosphate deacetylase